MDAAWYLFFEEIVVRKANYNTIIDHIMFCSSQERENKPVTFVGHKISQRRLNNNYGQAPFWLLFKSSRNPCQFLKCFIL